ncbi:hypothetical protein SS50377_21763 [Spironucleus salmonicida]|uniref:Uncharacterized protein n=1 Tax=Spironucleus salmonicida TaxID=348837 RepID=V6LLH7_9EUKA|nr:hypothetical protein SS50377_21763 [Spironucleus salmonicida]|eukprot:EST45402.1 Hypothetical protein SS50377_14677 [Spironucleus salmonicida]
MNHHGFLKSAKTFQNQAELSCLTAPKIVQSCTNKSVIHMIQQDEVQLNNKIQLNKQINSTHKRPAIQVNDLLKSSESFDEELIHRKNVIIDKYQVEEYDLNTYQDTKQLIEAALGHTINNIAHGITQLVQRISKNNRGEERGFEKCESYKYGG